MRKQQKKQRNTALFVAIISKNTKFGNYEGFPNEDLTYGMLTFVPADSPDTPFCVLGEMGIAADEEGTVAVGYIMDETTGIEMAFAVKPYDEESELISGVFPIGVEFEAICTDMTLDETLEYVQDLCDNYVFVGQSSSTVFEFTVI